ncbi:hypothetical protein HDU97_005852, partial [Phlyctochytrium planicorne]
MSSPLLPTIISSGRPPGYPAETKIQLPKKAPVSRSLGEPKSKPRPTKASLKRAALGSNYATAALEAANREPVRFDYIALKSPVDKAAVMETLYSKSTAEGGTKGDALRVTDPDYRPENRDLVDNIEDRANTHFNSQNDERRNRSHTSAANDPFYDPSKDKVLLRRVPVLRPLVELRGFEFHRHWPLEILSQRLQQERDKEMTHLRKLFMLRIQNPYVSTTDLKYYATGTVDVGELKAKTTRLWATKSSVRPDKSKPICGQTLSKPRRSSRPNDAKTEPRQDSVSEIRKKSIKSDDSKSGTPPIQDSKRKVADETLPSLERFDMHKPESIEDAEIEKITGSIVIPRDIGKESEIEKSSHDTAEFESSSVQSNTEIERITDSIVIGVELASDSVHKLTLSLKAASFDQVNIQSVLHAKEISDRSSDSEANILEPKNCCQSNPDTVSAVHDGKAVASITSKQEELSEVLNDTNGVEAFTSSGFDTTIQNLVLDSQDFKVSDGALNESLSSQHEDVEEFIPGAEALGYSTPELTYKEAASVLLSRADHSSIYLEVTEQNQGSTVGLEHQDSIDQCQGTIEKDNSPDTAAAIAGSKSKIFQPPQEDFESSRSRKLLPGEKIELEDIAIEGHEEDNSVLTNPHLQKSMALSEEITSDRIDSNGLSSVSTEDDIEAAESLNNKVGVQDSRASEIAHTWEQTDNTGDKTEMLRTLSVDLIFSEGEELILEAENVPEIHPEPADSLQKPDDACDPAKNNALIHLERGEVILEVEKAVEIHPQLAESGKTPHEIFDTTPQEIENIAHQSDENSGVIGLIGKMPQSDENSDAQEGVQEPESSQRESQEFHQQIENLVDSDVHRDPNSYATLIDEQALVNETFAASPVNVVLDLNTSDMVETVNANDPSHFISNGDLATLSEPIEETFLPLQSDEVEPVEEIVGNAELQNIADVERRTDLLESVETEAAEEAAVLPVAEDVSVPIESQDISTANNIEVENTKAANASEKFSLKEVERDNIQPVNDVVLLPAESSLPNSVLEQTILIEGESSSPQEIVDAIVPYNQEFDGSQETKSFSQSNSVEIMNTFSDVAKTSTTLQSTRQENAEPKRDGARPIQKSQEGQCFVCADKSFEIGSPQKTEGESIAVQNTISLEEQSSNVIETFESEKMKNEKQTTLAQSEIIAVVDSCDFGSKGELFEDIGDSEFVPASENISSENNEVQGHTSQQNDPLSLHSDEPKHINIEEGILQHGEGNARKDNDEGAE